MTHRQRFFAVLEGRPVDRVPYFPDITTWYQASRLGVGTEQPFFPGQYIPDGIELHRSESRLTDRLGRLSFLDFYREFDWGLLVHVRDWFEERYGGGVEKVVSTEGHLCIPFYKKACAIIHQAGKFASTHLDGNFKGYLPFINETRFDLLDGCTPAPMFNYEVEELADAVRDQMHCYCGVPAGLFTIGMFL